MPRCRGTGLAQGREKVAGGLFFAPVEPARGLHADQRAQPGPAGPGVHHPKLLEPDPAQDVNGGQLPEQGGLLVGCYSLQEPPPVLPDLLRVGYPSRCGVRQAILLGAGTVPGGPLRLQVAGQPVGQERGQAVEREAHRFPHALQAVHVPDTGQHMRRVRSLFAPGFQPLLVLATNQQVVKESFFGLTGHQPLAKFRQDAKVKPGVGQLQAQQLLSVNPTAHGIGRLAVGEIFGELQQRHHRQLPGRLGRLPALRKQVGKEGVVIQGAQGIAQLHIAIAVRESRLRYLARLGRNRRAGLGL